MFHMNDREKSRHGVSTEFQNWLVVAGAADVVTALATLVPNAAVVMLDSERRVVLWSGDAERLLGWPRERVLGRPCPNGVVCDGMPTGEPRAFGAVVRVRRSDGSHLVARHYGQMLDAGGSVHLLTAVEEAAWTPLAGPELVDFHGLVSRDPGMLELFETVRNVAATEATVLVRGESGSGKELVARAIHRESGRRNGPFVAVNCAAFSPSLLESELFGHKRGAFTGATADRAGIFAQANGGTLFLDEVAELPLDLQSKLLRVLQERSFVPVGGTKPVTVDVRVVAATHEALREAVKAGRFREDLMYRLRVVPIFLPPLRERRQDVDLLLHRAIEAHNRLGRRRIAHVGPDANRALLEHAWPGNVRELLNVVEHVFAVARGPELQLADLPPEFRETRAPALSARAPRRTVPDEIAAIRDALARTGGDVGRAADLLGVSRVTLWRRRRKHGL